jgi:hypothetical protein
MAFSPQFCFVQDRRHHKRGHKNIVGKPAKSPAQNICHFDTSIDELSYSSAAIGSPDE